MNTNVRVLAGFLAGLLIGVFIVVNDEIINVARYSIDYPYPLIGSYHIFDAYSLAVVFFFLPGIVLLIAALVVKKE